MKSTLPTVTVAISAYNEEPNIKAFLESVLAQKEAGFTLKQIWVYSDGSTDKTVEIAKSFGSPKIKVVDSPQRLGKSTRLNDIYAKLETDLLVQSDADVVYAHPLVIRDIIAPLISDPKVGMCGGDPQPTPARTFTEKAVNCTFYAYAPLRRELRGGNNIYSVDGRILAYRKDLVKRIHIPADTTANDAYTFFCCITMGYQYRYVETAVVLFRSPQTLKDQIKQNTRFLTSPVKMGKHFPPTLVAKERYVPKNLLLKHMIAQFVRHPILCTYIVLINLYCKMQAQRTEKAITALWDMARTTKVFDQSPSTLGAIKTITIGVSAYNEAQNIAYLLASIAAQEQTNFAIDTIYVFCDGCTDNTAMVVRQIAKTDTRIHVIVDPKRKGKAARLNQLYSLSTSQLIVVFDGDVVLAHPHVLDQLIQPFGDDQVVMVSANNQPVKATTTVGRIINAWFYLWFLVRSGYQHGSNVHNARGCGVALRTSFAQSIRIPPGIVSDSKFFYFCAREREKVFVFAHKAIIYFRTPGTLADYFLQKRRSPADRNKLKAMFGPEIEREYHIPLSYKLRAVAAALLADPLFTLLAGLFFTVIRPFIQYRSSKENTTVWDIVQSTKLAIKPEATPI